MRALKRATLAEQAYEELRSQIVSGRLRAGERLLAEELADRLAISQTPVKEAIAQLERDGLVEGFSRRASVVRHFTPQDIVEIFEARTLAELHCLESGFAAGRVTPAFARRLRAIFEAHIREVEKQEEDALADAVRLDREFHETLVELGANATIADWHRVVLRQTQTVRNFTLRSYTLERTKTEHAAIVEAIERGDREASVEALRAHLTASRDAMLSRAPEDLPVMG
ncbi:DNA-binding GntR family transcriptional regulator [Kaistia hirudinis]|uniref:DNA-binding GntR family transcriptional regulator n=1 Tax=Kaistia hirudinis TaxID=1293440 RepID=A0A840AM07_9HYPH|nr:GntR family transcriptional regulator [Kaistia hirudinis]MBB3930378.1 DNA-binding GntR family transcriptional regulator [Kaistia hirudinis]